MVSESENIKNQGYIVYGDGPRDIDSPRRHRLFQPPIPTGTVLPAGMLSHLIRLFGPAVGYRREERRLLVLMYLAGLFQGYAQTQAVNTLPFVRIAFDLSSSDMSRLFAVARIGSLIAIVYAVFGDRWGRRGPFISAYLVLLLATGATALAILPSIYTALQVLARAGAAALAMLATVLLAEQMRWENRAWAISFYATAVALGSGAGLVVLPVAQVNEGGWRWLFGAALLGLPVYLLLRIRVPESPVFRHQQRPAGFLRPLYGRYAGRFWLTALYGLLISSFSAVAVTFAFEHMVNGLGFSTFEAARIMLIGGSVGGLGFFAGGRLADSLGRKPAIFLALITAVAGGIAFYWWSDPGMLLGAAALAGFGSSIAQPVSSAQRTELFPTAIRATASQWLHSVAVLGSILGLSIAGYTIDIWGLPVTVTVLGSGVFLAILVQTLIPETLGSQMG